MRAAPNNRSTESAERAPTVGVLRLLLVSIAAGCLGFFAFDFYVNDDRVRQLDEVEASIEFALAMMAIFFGPCVLAVLAISTGLQRYPGFVRCTVACAFVMFLTPCSMGKWGILIGANLLVIAPLGALIGMLVRRLLLPQQLPRLED